MNDISIVTAFFDIGRGDWTPDKGLPHYLQRTTKTYLERFGYLAKLKNKMVIYTSEDLVDCRIVSDLSIRLRVTDPDTIY